MKQKILESSEGRRGLGDWHTHLPMLTEVLTRLQPASILELGAGDYSTAVLNAYARANPAAKVLSVENNPEWAAGLVWMNFDRHEIRPVEAWSYADYGGPWDFVFIDHNPEKEARVPALKFYLEQGAGVVLIHDCNYPDRYGATLEEFQYVLHDRRYRFHTTLASSTHDLTLWHP